TFFGSSQRSFRRFLRNDEKSGNDPGEQQQRACNCRQARTRATLPKDLELLWKLRIPDLIVVQINNPDPRTMLYFKFPQVMKTGLPMRIVFQIISHMSGEENVAGVTAIHHPLRDVDPRA